MRFIVLGMVLTLSLFATEEINKKFESNKNCEACHMDISSKWETSRHSNSHFTKNDLFKKSLLYMVQEEPRFQLNELKVTCAKCHNPRLTQKSVTQKDKYLLLMDLEHVNKEYDQKLNTKNMKNGINCVVCHNIDEIHTDKSKGSQGMHDIKFGPQGTMFGPFEDANSPYHKTKKRDHFVNDDPKLCFACHYSTENHNNVEVYATGKEYDMYAQDTEQSVEGCKECHMSPKRKGVASNYAKSGEKPKERMVREHRFSSVDNSNILHDHIDVKSSSVNGKFILKVTNNTPHNIPTGYGLREIILKVSYFDKKDKNLGNERVVLGVKWRDKNGKYTIPHMATMKVEDTRLEGKSSKEYSFNIPKGANYAKYTFSYRLIDEHMAKKIGVTDEFFLKEYTFSEQRVHL
ncbi:multiheme c-type cytochrome [Sulfurovum sp.]|uniref:multiheme c-type cytochrome n=1 Tax=Sulfurovum sp. TaxID=1969726 RepID=UPI002867E6D8|nr:multiheme c-type cytochrome [Sulfurovum sp.]